MKKDNHLPSYIWGLLTGLVFIPVISEALNIVYSYIQAALIKPTKIVLKGNQEVSEMQGEENDEEVVSSNNIGFTHPGV